MGMTNSKDKSRLKSLLSEPLLLNGEDREAYDELLAAVIETVQPSDILEHIWTSEAVEKQWEALRQRQDRLHCRQLAKGTSRHAVPSDFIRADGRSR
jgi:hypothetical protein